MPKKILMLTALATFVIGVTNTTNAVASDDLQVCGRYYRPSYGSWSKTYKLTGQRLNGKELNQKVASSSYKATQQYVVITWKKSNEHTAIAIPKNWTGDQETAFKDQNGRAWRLMKGWADCNKPSEP